MNTDMLTCEDALERMSQALDGPLPLEERQALEEHLESCPECRRPMRPCFRWKTRSGRSVRPPLRRSCPPG